MKLLSKAVEQVIDEFTSNPANFTVEVDIAARLKRIVNENTNKIHATGRHNSRSAQNVKDHSEYADRICSSTKIDSAHCEVNIRDLHAPETVRLVDLVVFKNSIDFVLDNGTKKFPSSMVREAAEIKYVKNKKYLRPRSQKREEIEKDIFRLDQLSNADERYALIFSNFDLSRRHDGKQTFDDLATISSDVEVIHAYPGGVFDPI